MTNLFKRTSKAALLAALTLGALCAHAGPKEDIVADMQAGRWAQADLRLTHTLQAHPDNALARFWHAEVLTKEGKLAEARADLQKAEDIDPGEHFSSNPSSLSRLKAKLGLTTNPPMSSSPTASATQEVGAPTASVPAQQVVAAEHTGLDSAGQAQEESAPFASLTTAVSSVYIGLAIAALVVAVIVLLNLSERRDARKETQKNRDNWEGILNDDIRALGDAVAASDANDKLSPEVKLANFDRAKKAKSELGAVLANKATWSDATMNSHKNLHSRTLDIVADLQGKMRPSEQAEMDNALRRAYGAPGSPEYQAAQARLSEQADALAQQRYYAGPTVVVQDSGNSLMTNLLLMEGISELADSRERSHRRSYQSNDDSDYQARDNSSSRNDDWSPAGGSSLASSDDTYKPSIDTGGSSWGGSDSFSSSDSSSSVDVGGGGGDSGSW